MFSTKVAQNPSQEERAFATLLANYDGCKRVFSPGATLTLTQSGLLAVLLERQCYAAIQLALHRARRKKMGAALWTALAWPIRVLKDRAREQPLVEDQTTPLA